MKISVIGAGYVGLSIATMLSVNNEVKIYDINTNKIDQINKRISPIKDELISEYFLNKPLNLKAYDNLYVTVNEADYIMICTPTNFDEKDNKFDTSSIEETIDKICKINKECTIIIKSTIPIGYTKTLIKKYNMNIVFCPEFLREGTGLYDCLYPSRIIFGLDKNNEKLVASTKKFNSILLKSIKKENVKILYMNYDEAESVKLFANTYLAMRIAFFNELDSFCIENNISSKDIIDGVCADERIGNYYNNPSFGYGGYCLPKDTKQLLNNFYNVPKEIINATINSNLDRKNYIIKDLIKYIEKHNINNIGIYKLSMKSNSDNYRNSSIIDILKLLKKSKSNLNIYIYEPNIKDDEIFDCTIIKDLSKFKEDSELIVANRKSKELNDINYKVYTRDIYNNN